MYLLLVLYISFNLPTCELPKSLFVTSTKEREFMPYCHAFILHIYDCVSSAKNGTGSGRVNIKVRIYIVVLSGERQILILAKVLRS